MIRESMEDIPIEVATAEAAEAQAQPPKKVIEISPAKCRASYILYIPAALMGLLFLYYMPIAAIVVSISGYLLCLITDWCRWEDPVIGEDEESMSEDRVRNEFELESRAAVEDDNVSSDRSIDRSVDKSTDAEAPAQANEQNDKAENKAEDKDDDKDVDEAQKEDELSNE